MIKKTLAQRFKEKASDLMPHQSDLQNLNDAIDDFGHIDEIMYRDSEYLGGMAAVIIELVRKDLEHTQ